MLGAYFVTQFVTFSYFPAYLASINTCNTYMNACHALTHTQILPPPPTKPKPKNYCVPTHTDTHKEKQEQVP